MDTPLDFREKETIKTVHAESSTPITWKKNKRQLERIMRRYCTGWAKKWKKTSWFEKDPLQLR